MNPIWLVRAKRWVQNPPSAARIKLVFGIIAACIAIVGLEWLEYWPDWATADSLRSGR